MTKTVVIGATGNTGRNAVRTLSEAGHTVVAVTRSPEGKVAKALASLPGVVVKLLDHAFEGGADRLFIATPNTLDQFLVETAYFIKAKNAGVKYIVKISTFGPAMQYSSEIFYPRAHLAVEHFLDQGTIPFTTIRPALFYVFLGVNFAQVRETRTFRTLLGKASHPVIDPDDVGAAAAALLRLDDPSPHFGKKYDLVGPEVINDNTIATALSTVLNTPITSAGTLSDEEIRASFKAEGFQDKEAEGLFSAMKWIQSQVDPPNVQTSHELLELARPTSTFEKFARKQYQ